MGKCNVLIRDSLATARRLVHGRNDYGRAHCTAWHEPSHGLERGIVGAVKALADLADDAEAMGLPIGEDGYGGDYWLQIASAVVKLMSADCGRLDGGTVDRLVRDMARTAGFDEAEAESI